MKYPQSIPSTPVKRRPIPECAVSQPTPHISKKIGEGSFYNIYLTAERTVLRIAKRRESGDLEASILEKVASDCVNKMLRWWSDGGYSHFEMEYCPGGELTAQIEEYRRLSTPAEELEATRHEMEIGSNVNSDLSSCDDIKEDSKNDIFGMNNCEPIKNENYGDSDFISINDSTCNLGETKRAKRVSFDLKQPENIISRKVFNSLNETEKFSDSFTDIERVLEHNTSSIYTDNESESSDVSFTPEEVSLPGWAVKMMSQISHALSVVHKAGIIHMDIRPDNILRIDDDYKLCDFNISKLGEGRVDRDGDFMYMAPEVLKNRCYYSSDIYSLGVVYLELCNPGRALPKEGNEHRKIRRNDFRGWKVDGIGRKMLEKNPLKRCSANELCEYFREKMEEN